MTFLNIFLFILFVSAGIVGSIVSHKLTVWAALTGGLLAACVFMGAGWLGIAFMTAFFLLATVATSYGKRSKPSQGTGESNRRNTAQVLANGGIAGVLGVLAYLFPSQQILYVVMMAGAFSSATADTVSSEIGTVLGKKFYDVLSFKSGVRGDDGVISLEGLLAGIAGSILIAIIYSIGEQFDSTIAAIIVAGTMGNLADSYLGAILERKKILGNNTVNFLNTLTGALVMLLYYLS